MQSKTGMAQPEPMTTATSASGVTTTRDPDDSGSNLENLMKLKKEAEESHEAAILYLVAYFENDL